MVIWGIWVTWTNWFKQFGWRIVKTRALVIGISGNLSNSQNKIKKKDPSETGILENLSNLDKVGERLNQRP